MNSFLMTSTMLFETGLFEVMANARFYDESWHEHCKFPIQFSMNRLCSGASLNRVEECYFSEPTRKAEENDNSSSNRFAD